MYCMYYLVLDDSLDDDLYDGQGSNSRLVLSIHKPQADASDTMRLGDPTMLLVGICTFARLLGVMMSACYGSQG